MILASRCRQPAAATFRTWPSIARFLQVSFALWGKDAHRCSCRSEHRGDIQAARARCRGRPAHSPAELQWATHIRGPFGEAAVARPGPLPWAGVRERRTAEVPDAR